jgi:hypothetical protein
MTWLEGEPILSRLDRAPSERAALAITMFRAWYVPFFEYGVLHGDPHLGNYTVRGDGGLNLNVWAQFVYEPLLADQRQTLGELTGDIHGREIAERVIAELHRAGGVDIPRPFVIMDRAAIGLGAVFLRLQAEVNWHRLFNEVIAAFDVEALARRQAEMLARHGLPEPGTA